MLIYKRPSVAGLVKEIRIKKTIYTSETYSDFFLKQQKYPIIIMEAVAVTIVNNSWTKYVYEQIGFVKHPTEH